VTEVRVVCRPEWREPLLDALGPDAPVFASAEDAQHVGGTLKGNHDAVAFCPVGQFFADPARLDDLAALEVPAGTARVVAVLASEPELSLTGGVFLQILTRLGVRAASEGHDLLTLPTARCPAWPEAPELRLSTAADYSWAVAAWENTLAEKPSAQVADLEASIDRLASERFPFWDGIGPRPRSILTVRCTREPLFVGQLQYLRRLRPDAIDVICPAALAGATSQLPGVTRVVPFDAPNFSVDALGPQALADLQARAYDLCVVPRLEPTAHGYRNVIPIGAASAARSAIWIDIFGNWGLLAGAVHGWDPTFGPAPTTDADSLHRRAHDALARFAAHAA
jgi:hypothetical protein